jgi:5'-nucleotidase
MHRRYFLKNTLLAGGSVALAGHPLGNKLLAATGTTRLTILHTNDVHSRLEPFPMDGGRNQGQGGVAARAALIKQIRQENEHVLLLDAGDIFQGTPFFNMYLGEPEIKAMSAMGYDACTMGNHDFDAGVENFARQMRHATFDCLVSNYDFTNTPLAGKVLSHKIFKKGPLKIGVFGLGIKLQGLVPENLYGATRYLDPLEKANEMAYFLKKEKRCDMVICLSHLGYKYNNDTISDVVLAAQSRHIDLIIGGHTHTFLDAPTVVNDLEGKPVLVNQVGFAGLRLGRIDIELEALKGKNLINAQSVSVEKKTRN